jgi:hypothetical protein
MPSPRLEVRKPCKQVVTRSVTCGAVVDGTLCCCGFIRKWRRRSPTATKEFFENGGTLTGVWAADRRDQIVASVGPMSAVRRE